MSPISYLKIGAAVVVVATILGLGLTVKHWRAEAGKVPGLEARVSVLNGQLDSTSFSLEACEVAVREQNALVEGYLVRASEAERAVAAAKLDAERINLAWRKRWASLPPPPPNDCEGAMAWLVANAPRGWDGV